MKHILSTLAIGSLFLLQSGVPALALANSSLATSGEVNPFPENHTEPAIRFDTQGAVAAGRIQSGSESTPLSADVFDNGNGTLTLVIRDFFTALDQNESLSLRLNLRAAIPMETAQGKYPASLRAISFLRVDKSSGANVAAALSLQALGTPLANTQLQWPSSQRVGSNVVLSTFSAIENDADLRETFCERGQGILGVNFAVSALRESPFAGGFAVKPAYGRDLKITVVQGEAKECR